MAENYKFLYEQMKKMVEMYQDDIVPRLYQIIDDMKKNMVEVVRCKDCKHFYDTHINPAHSCKRGGTQVWDVSFTPDDFCSYGERREDDGR